MSSASSTRLVAILGLAAVALVAWLALTLSDRGGPTARVQGAAASAASVESSVPAAPALVQAEIPQEKTARAIPEPVDVDHEGPSAAELADAVWVGGRVIFPEGTPGDERAVVVAAGREFGSKKLHRAPVASDGSFRVAFAPKTKKAALRIEARYVFLEEAKELKLDASQAGVVLAPTLGGGVRGRLVLAPDAQRSAPELVGTTVVAWGWKQGLPRTRTTSAKVDAELAFEVGGLDPAIAWHVACAVKGFAPAEIESVRVVAARFAPVELSLLRGAVVSGTIRDEAGAPVAGAQLHTDAREHNPAMGPSVEPSSDENGRFSYRDLRAGTAHFVITAKGFVASTLPPLELSVGEERTSVDVVLSRGTAISGSARLSDGSPAVDVTVTAKPNREEEFAYGVWFQRDDPSAKTDAAGKFVITGLRSGPHEVSARTQQRIAESAPALAKRSARVRLEARRPNVAAGTADLVLVLESGTALLGRVVDDTGAPVPDFKLTLARKGSKPWENSARRSVSSKSDDGSFEIEGVGDGTWELVAQTKDGGESDPYVVKLPEEAGPLELVVARPARIRGTVLDPLGTPIAGASVRIDRDDHRFRYWANEDSAAKSDERGAFEAVVRPGIARVSAVHPTWAASAKHELTLAPSAPAAPLTLQLRRGGAITGTALDRDGKPLANREVSLWGEAGSLVLSTDAGGRFQFERLAPGEAHLNLQPSDAELEATRDEEGQVDWQAAGQPNRTKQVIVVEGQTVEVVLGGPTQGGLRMSGLLSAGSPIARGKLSFYGPMPTTSAGSRASTSAESRASTSDEQGRYEVVLPGPGKYSVTVARGGRGSVNLQVDVPPGPSFVFDIALPSGSIRGRVLDAQGEPAAGVQVHAARGGAREAHAEHGSAFFVSEETRDDGTFHLTALSEGTYTLTAMDPASYGHSGTSAVRGQAQLDGVVLTPGGAVEGVVLRFPITGELKGVVRSRSGAPVANAQILARASGGAGEAFGFARTGTNGKYRMYGLPVGTYTLCARLQGEGAAESQEFVVSERATPDVDVVLTPSNRLVALCEDEKGEVVLVNFELRDSRRRPWMDFGTNAAGEGEAEPAVPPHGRRFDHLPDGDYVIQASTKSRKSAEERVTLKGGVSREIRLRLLE